MFAGSIAIDITAVGDNEIRELVYSSMLGLIAAELGITANMLVNLIKETASNEEWIYD